MLYGIHSERHYFASPGWASVLQLHRLPNIGLLPRVHSFFDFPDWAGIEIPHSWEQLDGTWASVVYQKKLGFGHETLY